MTDTTAAEPSALARKLARYAEAEAEAQKQQGEAGQSHEPRPPRTAHSMRAAETPSGRAVPPFVRQSSQTAAPTIQVEHV